MMKFQKDQSIQPRISLVNPKREMQRKNYRRVLISFLFALVIGFIAFFLNKSLNLSLVISLVCFGFFFFYSYYKGKLSVSARVKKMESVFPDFLQLMSSNLRAGITIDRAMLLSAREEFDPLDKEILKTGRDITTGKDIKDALLNMSKRIGSDRIAKTILLIISGIKAGGDLAVLLEETAVHMREKFFLEKKAASSVLMYVIFIFIAVAVGAPALFGLSNILVEILSALLGSLPAIDATVSTPFTLSALNITTTFVFYFSLIFIMMINIMASLTLGLVSKGEEKEGLKFLIPITVVSYTIFFVVKFSLAGTVRGFFA